MPSLLQWLKAHFTSKSPGLPPAEAALPPYVDFSNDLIIPLPGVGDGTRMYCFPIKGDYDKILQVCNQRLNFSPLSQTTRYYPLTDHILLVVSDMKKGITLDGAYPKAGYITEKAVQLFVPVAECTRGNAGEWVAQRVLAFLPYIFVDNPISNNIGREHIGFPKGLARFAMPDDPASADFFRVDTFGFQQFNRENPQKADYFPWLTIDRATAADTLTAQQWRSAGEAWQTVKHTFERIPTRPEMVERLGFYIHELEDLAHAEIPMVFLKQFRDVAQPANACYQAIVEANGYVRGFHGGWFLGGTHTVRFPDVASYPVKQDLGLPDSYEVSHAFWVDADLEFQTGRVVWQYPAR